jgi:hypothetical protein
MLILRNTIAVSAFVLASAVAGCSSSGALPAGAGATSPQGNNSSNAIAPALDAITESDLKRDEFTMASDAMRGREAGTLDEMRATGWVAEQARKAGLQPAGEDSTFFQWWPMRRSRLSENSQITIGGKSLHLWKDAVVLNAATADLDLPIVFVADSAALSRTDVRGKAVAMVLPSLSTTPPALFTIRGNVQGLTGQLVRQRAAAIAAAGGAAAILLSNGSADLDRGFDANAAVTSRGQYGIDSAGGPTGAYARAANNGGRGRGNAAPAVPTFWLHQDMLNTVNTGAAHLKALVFTETFYYPSGNVIGVVRGTDPKLANEYVLYSGHQDHDGTRYDVAGDSIWNGADDNVSVSVALLATARAFVKHPAKRPILFVWHGAEERGLLGSRWFVNHPTVPHSQIIAVLNGDMIGRNNPDSAAILGVQPPHRNSIALADAALRANAELTHFAYFGASRSPISVHVDHPFRTKPITRFD